MPFYPPSNSDAFNDRIRFDLSQDLDEDLDWSGGDPFEDTGYPLDDFDEEPPNED